MTGSGYRIVEYEDQHLYPAIVGQQRSVLRRRVIEALQEGVSQFRQQYTSVTDQGVTPVPKMIGAGQIAVENLRTHDENGEAGYRYDLVIDFPPLKIGEPRVLQWMVELHQSPRSFGGYGHHVAAVTPTVPIERASISVRFEPPLAPAKCWRLDNVNPGDVRLEIGDEEELRKTDHYAEASWESPRVGFASGIAWRWEPESDHPLS